MSLALFSGIPSFDFMGKRWVGFGVSIALTVLSLFLLFTKGLNYGIDFTSGVLMEIRSEKPVDLAPLRSELGKQGFGEVSLQDMGDVHNVLIRIQVAEDADTTQVVATVKEVLNTVVGGTIDYRKTESVGPAVGDELIEAGVLAVIFSFAAIMIYVWFRFEWQYGFGAILALAHDTIMILGFFAFTQLDFGLPAVAAILTIIGYSINDSVVIYDRIRENMRRFKKMNVMELLNRSINETLSRTIVTALTTFLSAIALVMFGGQVLLAFSAAIAVGVFVGTYSSIYIAAPALYYLNIRNSLQEQVA
ncbi:MAG: protein translocase subunit SecF [Alphaproteobacteria bacterium]